MKNPYIIRSRISTDKFREILKLFSLDIEATKIAKITNISRNSINKIIGEIRTLIVFFCLNENPLGEGELEVDESYFGKKRAKGKRGRGATNKIPVFGMLKRNGKIYTQIVKNCSANKLIPIILEKSSAENTTIFSPFIV
jgi:transposase